MSLRVWLPLNRDLRNQGLSNVTVTNNGATFSDGYATVPANGITFQSSELGNPELKSGKSFSFAFWIKRIFEGYNYVIACGAWEIRFANTYVQVNEGGNSDYLFVRYYMNATDNTWYHISFTWDGTLNKLCLYVDGILRSETTGTPQNFNINSTVNVVYSGSMDFSDFRIYDHALSKKEVTELARGCVLHYPMNDTLNESTANLVSSLTVGNPNFISITDNVVTRNVQSGDGYFSINLSTPMIVDKTYTLSFETHYENKQDGETGTLWYNSEGEAYGAHRVKEGFNSFTFVPTSSYSSLNVLVWDDAGLSLNAPMHMWNFQLEKKDHATPFTGYGTTRTQQYLKDVSGFDNHSLITGSLPLVTTPKSPRYDKCMNIDNSGTNKNYANCTIAAPQVKSASFWVYVPSTIPTAITMLFTCLPYKLAFAWLSGGAAAIFPTNNQTYTQSANFVIPDDKKNKWCYFVVCRGDDDSELYIDGIKLQPNTRGYLNVYSNDLYIGARYTTDVNSYFTGQISDFRLYTTILSEEAIKDLYQTSLSIDKSQNGYCYELNESDVQNSVDVKKNGQLVCKNYSETITSFYDDNAYVEPDGSVWIRIFHHNSPSTNGVFSSSDTFTTKVYKDENRWFNVSVCNNVSKWELMVKQKTTSDANEYKARWIQNANPMTASAEDVTSDKIVVNTTSGYSNIVSSHGGLCHPSNTTYIIQYSDSKSSSWAWIGSWTVYNTGIERFRMENANAAVTTGYLDLYLRIDNLDEGTLARLGKTGVTMNEIHEV